MINNRSKLPTIHLGTDHAGFQMKEVVKTWLTSEGFKVVDHGADKFNALDDFTDFVSIAAKAVSEKSKTTKAIVFGGSGQGEAMMANRFKKVRAVVYYGGNEEIIKLSRQHNDANVLSIGSRFVSEDHAKKVIWDWLHTEPLVEAKYKRRNLKLDKLS